MPERIQPPIGLPYALSHIEKAQLQNSRLKAFAFLQDKDKVVAQVTQAQALPLGGLMVGIKDIIETVDMPTAFGSPIHANFRPRADASIVSQLRAAGAVVLGKTVSTPFAFLDPADTLNPIPQLADRTPGGSSSGSAAAVAADLVPFAVGTQTGGSVIRPASYCGVVGFKPSFDRFAMQGVGEFSKSLDTLGFFSKRTQLMRWVLGHLDASFLSTATERNSYGARLPKIGLLRQHPWGEAQPEAQVAIEQFVGQLRLAGYQVEEVSYPGSAAVAYEAHAIIQNFEAARALHWWWHNRREQLPALLQDLLGKAQNVQRADYDLAVRQMAEAKSDIDRLFDRVQLLLLPSAPGEPPMRDSTGVSNFNRLWTGLGLPTLGLPRWVKSATGIEVPIGMQLVARSQMDHQLLNWGEQIENSV